MTSIVYRWEGNGLARVLEAANTQSGPKKNTALRRAINHTGRKAFTRTKRELSRPIGASQAVIVKYGKLNAVAASNGRLEYLIIARGGPIPLKHFERDRHAPVCGPIPGGTGKLIIRLSS